MSHLLQTKLESVKSDLVDACDILRCEDVELYAPMGRVDVESMHQRLSEIVSDITTALAIPKGGDA